MFNLKSLFSTPEAKKEASFFSKLEIPFYSLKDNQSYLNAVLNRLPLASACISLRARKVRTTPWRIVDSKGIEVLNHNIIPLIQPNSFQKFEDILELMVWSLDTLGNAFAIKTEFSGTRFNRLFMLPAVNVVPFTIEDIFITKYQYQNTEKLLTIDPDEMIHFKYPNLRSPCWGLGLIEQAEILLQKNLNRDNYMSSFYKNGVVMSGVFSTDAVAVAGEQRERMKADFKNEMSGIGNFFKTFFAWGGFKFQPINANHRDSQDVEQSKLTRDDILAVFGVPGALLGFTDGVNYSTAEIQERVFINNTLIPLLNRLEDLISWEIVRCFNLSWRFEFVKPINENLSLKSTWVSRAFQDGIISKEQYSKLMGVKADGQDSQGTDKPISEPSEAI
jgi:HK97 family phage portal protein